MSTAYRSGREQPHINAELRGVNVGHRPRYATIYVLIFATYIIGDLVAIPFAHVFGKEAVIPKRVLERTPPTASAA